MAVDEALMEGVRAGGAPVLRLYRWAPACLSLGRNQPARGEYDEGRIAAAGLQVVRRLTGGRAVLHDRELTYSVSMGERALGSPRAAYAAINRSIVAALHGLGVDALLQPRGATPAPAPSLAPCFRDPAEGEVVVAGRKLVGSAQYRERGVLLQHGSLLLAGDQRRIADLLVQGGETDDEAPAVLSELLPLLPTWSDLVTALAAGFRSALGIELRHTPLSPPEEERATALAGRYADLAWVWRL
jgi:lipoyl(octanoyl) transferase